MAERKFDVMWDDNPVNITAEANFIWGIANKLRGVYLPDKYGDVVIPMTIIRRLECTLEDTKSAVIEAFEKHPNYPTQKFEEIAEQKFYNTSKFTLKELCNDTDNIAENFKSYVNGFSPNALDVLKELDIFSHIEKMEKGDCLLNVVKAFSELDLNPKTFDSIKMGYIFENLIGRFYQNVDAGQFYTGRDIIKLMVSLLTAEGCDDLFDDHKVITICDQACGTGGMLTTAYSYLKHFNTTADIRLFGQEYNGTSYAVGLAEMLIKGQDGKNYRHTDTFKEDCFKNIKMRLILENPPFGTPWSGKDAKAGQEDAVRAEFAKRLEEGSHCRWPAGLPSGGDSQLIFVQSAIEKLDEHLGRAAIIENGSPLFAGGTTSGESQIRKWILDNDLLEAIVAMPIDLFYNTGIQTYIWILSKNKSNKRRGKVQLIDATSFCHKLRKPIGNKKNEFSPEDRNAITKLYSKFEENEFCKIYSNNEFLYREYTIMQPLQRSYGISIERINGLINKGSLSFIYDEAKVFELKNKPESLTEKETKKLKTYKENKPLYDAVIKLLTDNINDKVYYKLDEFKPVITKLLMKYDNKIIQRVIDGLSIMDKKAEIQKDRKGNVIYDKESKDYEIVRVNEDINTYMKREVLPHVPDAAAFFEENLISKNKVIKTGAEFHFPRYFYKRIEPEPSDLLKKQLKELEDQTRKKMDEILKD